MYTKTNIMRLGRFDINTDNIAVSPYCRISTDKEDQANSLESQIKYYTDYILRRENWRIGEVYFDEGISGTSLNKRDNFNRMINDALAGKINLIITKEVSRFARNTVDTLVITRKLKEQGVGVYFVNDNINTLDSDGELRLTIMAGLAQEESRKTSERVKWGQKRRMEAGIVFGRDMLGYNVSGGKLRLIPEEAETVKLIFHKFLIEGKGTRVIARELYESGIMSKRGPEFSNSMILKILRNEKYAGDLRQKKTFTPDYLSHKKKYNHGEEEQVFLRDNHEPIIDRETWNKTQQELARRSPDEERKKRYSNRYWCSGKLNCECGDRFVSTRKQLKNGNQYKAWRCFKAVQHGVEKIGLYGETLGCNSCAINDKVLLVCMKKAVSFIQQNKKSIIKEIIGEIEMVRATVVPKDTSGEQIDAIQNKKNRAIDLVLDGLISRDDLKIKIQEYDIEIEQITKRLTEIKNENMLYQRQSADMQIYIDEIEKIMQFDFENDLLYREVLDVITIYKDKTIGVRLNCLPYEIIMQYKTSGKDDGYNVDITSLDIKYLEKSNSRNL